MTAKRGIDPTPSTVTATVTVTDTAAVNVYKRQRHYSQSACHAKRSVTQEVVLLPEGAERDQ